jgi:phosphoribosylanthranilate isomerase
VQIHDPIGDPGRPCIVAFNAAALSAPEAWPSSATALLLDAPQAGSGAAWDWTKAQNTPRHLPCILAGGLNPANVATAINAAHPWAVDVSSGVEHARGTKDLGLVQAFIAAVRSCDAAAGRHDAPHPADFATLA